ncbi:MAG TPA: type II toxin-antitoxin system HicA family toxin [bacterium]|nr:type II toxin-antitoxin system HicA family toxin [bacterium]
MGRLAGCKYADVAAKLRRAGFKFDRSAKGSRKIWRNPASRRRTMVLHRGGDITEGTLRAIIKQAGLTVREFLEL